MSKKLPSHFTSEPSAGIGGNGQVSAGVDRLERFPLAKTRPVHGNLLRNSG